MGPLRHEPEGRVPALLVAREAAGGTFQLRPRRHPAGQDDPERSGRNGGGSPMRALVSTTVYAIACALFLALATTASAGFPGKPIDRGESPIPSPVEVGDPDQPPSIIIVPYIGRVIIFHLRLGFGRANRPHMLPAWRHSMKVAANAR